MFRGTSIFVPTHTYKLKALLHKRNDTSAQQLLLLYKYMLDYMFRPIKWSSSGPSQRYTESQKAAHTYGIPLVFTSWLV